MERDGEGIGGKNFTSRSDGTVLGRGGLLQTFLCKVKLI